MNNSEINTTSHDTDDVDALSRDADRQRERIEKTLDVLGGKLSPEHMKDQAFDLVREHGGDIASSLQRSAKNNPVPLLLTGIGIAWMMMSQRDEKNREDHYRRYPEFRQPATDTRYVPDQRPLSERHSSDYTAGSDYSSNADYSSDQKLTDKVGNAKDSLMESASDSWDSVTGSARDARDATGERLESMRQSSAAMSNNLQQQYRSAAHNASQSAEQWANDASRFMREQPLVAGAMGIALGALLGGLLPTTDKERQLARQAVNSDAGQKAVARSEEMMDSAKAEASSRIEQAGEFAKEKAKEAKESARTEA